MEVDVVVTLWVCWSALVLLIARANAHCFFPSLVVVLLS